MWSAVVVAVLAVAAVRAEASNQSVILETTNGGLCNSIHSKHCQGNDIKNVHGVTASAQCCHECEKTDGCKAWSWQFQYRLCILKTRCSNPVSDSSFHSGIASPTPSPPGPPAPPAPSPPTPSGGKAGVALHLEHKSQADRDAIARGGISWYYNWAKGGPTEQGLAYFPQIHSAGDVSHCSHLQKSSVLLGFNEPNMNHGGGGSHMTVDQVVQLWPQVEKCASDLGAQTLVGPAVANIHPSSWYDEFFGKCKHCRVDAIAIHSYSCDVGGMKNYINTFKKYNKPLWLTEFACADNPKGIPGNSGGSKTWNWECEYMKGVIPYLMSEPAVAKFSWYSYNSKYTGDANLVSGGKLTQLGDCYHNLIGGALTATANLTDRTYGTLMI